MGLSDKEADEMWEYFDGCLVFELVECIVDSHPGLEQIEKFDKKAIA